MAQKYILDTNIFNSLSFNDKNAAAIRARIAAEPTDTVFLSTVTAEEMLRGALATIRDNEKKRVAGQGHFNLAHLVHELAAYDYLPFDEAANAIYLAYPAAVRRLGADDCKIAAVATVHGTIVVTRNRQHFDPIPGIRIEDWTVPPNPGDVR